MATINGTTGNDTLDGTAGDDSIFGDAGNDQLNASTGNDTLNGGVGVVDIASYLNLGSVSVNMTSAGNGTVTKPGPLTDTLISIEFVQGSNNADTINGSSSDDGFMGSDGADTYNGSGGNDYISYGSSGASSVTVTYSSFGNGTVLKNGLGTTDTLNSIEWVRGTTGNDTYTGANGSNDSFIGSTGDDSYNGQGNSSVGGGDVLSYFHWGTETGRSIIATYASPTSQSIAKSSASGTDTTSNVEQIQGTPQADIFTGSSGNDSYIGSLGEDTYTGMGGNDFINYNFFRGTPNGIRVDLGVGTVDKMATGSGFGADGSGTPDGGTDYISGVNSISGTNFNDYFQGGDPTHSIFLQSSATEFFSPGAGNDTIEGTKDLINDVGSVFVLASYTNLTSLNGNVGINFDLSQNFFNKGTFAVGGGSIGTDNFQHLTGVVGTNVSDTLTGGGEYNSFTGNFDIMRPMGGNDTVNGSDFSVDRADYGNSTMAMTVFLYGQDSAGPTGDFHGVAMNGYGVGEVDTLNNIEQIQTGSGSDTLTGSDRTVDHAGHAMHETYLPGAGNNVIDGKGGQDVVQYNSALAAISATVGGASGGVSHDGFWDTLANVEGVIASYFDDTLTGTSGATYQYFEGLGGDDSIDANNTLVGALNEASYQRSGGPVNASLVTNLVQDGYGGTDTLTGINGLRGSMWDDTLVGSANGGEVFRGMSGLDVMNGGGGAFDEVRYDLDQQPGWLGPNQGVSINLGAGQALDGWGMPDKLIGFTAAVGSPWNDTITGTAGDDKLNGIEGTDLIMGGNGHDSLIGGAGDDTIDGGASTDTMIGGLGDDAFMVDSSGDLITENVGEGNDFVALADVYVSASYTLPANVESLIMSGSRSTALTANTADNFIRGNNGGNLINGLAGADTIDGGAGNDQLNGGIGKDTLIGGLGSDTFLFNAPISSANSDLIKDFHGNTPTENDQLAFSHARFTALGYDTLAGGTQALNPAEFVSGNGLANDPTTPTGVHVIYDSGSGRLYYDADAQGAGAKVLIAMFTGHPGVTASDILVSP